MNQKFSYRDQAKIIFKNGLVPLIFINFTYMNLVPCHLFCCCGVLTGNPIDLVDPQHRQSATRHAIHSRVDKNSNKVCLNNIYLDSKLFSALLNWFIRPMIYGPFGEQHALYS